MFFQKEKKLPSHRHYLSRVSVLPQFRDHFTGFGDEVLEGRTLLGLVFCPVLHLFPCQVHSLLQLLQVDHDVLQRKLGSLLQESQLGVEVLQIGISANEKIKNC